MSLRSWNIIAFSILFSALVGCDKKSVPTQEELMEEYLAEKLEIVRKNEWDKCYDQTVRDAVVYVDSIIYQKINFKISDSLQSPAKPLKPGRPYDTLKLDSLKVKPILSDTLGKL